MGTRADFYIGRGPDAKWLGSIAFDGYPDGGHPEPVLQATTRKQFMAEVRKLRELDHWTSPGDGWPWPWENSGTTDFAYAWDDGAAWVSCFGGKWLNFTEHLRLAKDPDHDWPEQPAAVFPDMSEIQNVTLGPRSGVLVFTARR